MSKAVKNNSQVPKWRKGKRLGKGGNGEVYEVTNAAGEKYALKELARVRGWKDYHRFKDEITVLKKLSKQAGVINIVDHYMPEKPTASDRPYYVMPVCGSFEQYLKEKSHKILYDSLIHISDILAQLHAQGITHRDIKPANMLMMDGEVVLSDFGLANFPEKENVSSRKEPIGPKWTIAPEMKRISSTAEFKKADIYSLAKTLWILVTGKSSGFEGQYIPNSSISIDKFIPLKINTTTIAGNWDYNTIVLLEKLLVESTDNDPAKRPTAAEFRDQLKYWHETNDDFVKRNPYEWEDALKKIFGVAIPRHSEWTKLEDIYQVLSVLTQYDNLNHAFYPGGGGDDIDSVEKAYEPGCLRLSNGYIVKPQKLTFELLGDPSWSYFRLELAELEPLSPTRHKDEDVYITEEGAYTNDPALTVGSVTRVFSGNYILVSKRSLINTMKGQLDQYSDYHSEMNETEYRDYLSAIHDAYLQATLGKDNFSEN